MRIKILFLFNAVVFIFSCQSQNTAGIAVVQKAVDGASYQATEKDQIPEQEQVLIGKVRTAIKNKNKNQLRSLYYLKNANPELVAMIPYVINPLVKVDLKMTTIRIIPDKKAAEFNMKFTVLYVGKIEIKTTHSNGGTTRTAIPVGIKDGKYYLTIGAK